MSPGKKYQPEDFLRVFLARRWFFIVPFVTVALTTALVVYLLPDRYRSTAVVQVIPPRIPSGLIKTMGASNLSMRLQAMTPRILSRSRLENLIVEFNLYPDERRSELMEDVTERMMTRDINIRPTRGNAFQVAYESEDRVTALRVTQRIAQLFIDRLLATAKAGR